MYCAHGGLGLIGLAQPPHAVFVLVAHAQPNNHTKEKIVSSLWKSVNNNETNFKYLRLYYTLNHLLEYFFTS
jgi:hypothetical protein